MYVCWLCAHRCICLWDISSEMHVGIILQQVNLPAHTWAFWHHGTALTSRVSFLRWELCLHSQSSTVHCSPPAYSSFPHPFIPMASMKSKSTRGHSFGCPKTLSWVGGSVQHQQGRSCEGRVKSSGCSSCSGKGRMLPGRHPPWSQWELSQALSEAWDNMLKLTI